MSKETNRSEARSDVAIGCVCVDTACQVSTAHENMLHSESVMDNTRKVSCACVVSR